MTKKESCFAHLLTTGPVPRLLPRLLLISVMASLTLGVVYKVANAQIQTVPSWVGNLLLENSTITADPTLTAPEAQGLGQKFELLFAMMNNQDPQNPDNDVISVNTAPFGGNVIGVAVRNMLPGAKIETLTNQISLKYLFVPLATVEAVPRASSSSLTPVTARRPTTRSGTLEMLRLARYAYPTGTGTSKT